MSARIPQHHEAETHSPSWRSEWRGAPRWARRRRSRRRRSRPTSGPSRRWARASSPARLGSAGLAAGGSLMWFAQTFRVLSRRMTRRALPVSLCSRMRTSPVPRSFHSESALTKRKSLARLRRSARLAGHRYAARCEVWGREGTVPVRRWTASAEHRVQAQSARGRVGRPTSERTLWALVSWRCWTWSLRLRVPRWRHRCSINKRTS